MIRSGTTQVKHELQSKKIKKNFFFKNEKRDKYGLSEEGCGGFTHWP